MRKRDAEPKVSRSGERALDSNSNTQPTDPMFRIIALTEEVNCSEVIVCQASTLSELHDKLNSEPVALRLDRFDRQYGIDDMLIEWPLSDEILDDLWIAVDEHVVEMAFRQGHLTRRAHAALIDMAS